MRYKGKIMTFGLAAAFMLLIIDSRTSAKGAAEGIDLCIRVVIPSLLPFLFLSACLYSANLFTRMPSLRVLGVPKGGESIFLLGLLGGYPVGSQLIYDAYRNKNISKANARRLLGFCNNPGPSFIFGMLAPLFTSSATAWYIWIILILSAIITGLLLPGKQNEDCTIQPDCALSLPEALSKSIRSIALICGWVVIFRVFFSFGEKYLFYRIPQVLRVIILGALELTNGCVSLNCVPSESVRFVLCTAMLSFGGLCVAMQTASVTKDLGLGMYFPGKILQTIVSILLASGVSMVIF